LQDIVERFELLLVLCFVVVEDISNSGGSWMPTAATLLVCGRIFFWEVRQRGCSVHKCVTAVVWSFSCLPWVTCVVISDTY
jgi:hypothetical protein